MKNKAQSILEYSLLISVVVSALIGMALYMHRGMRGRMFEVATAINQVYYQPGKSSSDDIIITGTHEEASRTAHKTTVKNTSYQDTNLNEGVQP